MRRVILEVGLGGRLDSTNVVEPAVCVITTIELEHTDLLGDTLAAIAGEKAGIIKAGRPVVLGSLPPEAEAVAMTRAQAVGAPVARMGLVGKSCAQIWWQSENPRRNLRTGLLQSQPPPSPGSAAPSPGCGVPATARSPPLH